MKTIIFALLVAAAFAGNQWNVPDSLPSSYTGLPFSFQLGTGYTYKPVNLPTWAAIDAAKGILSGVSDKAGAWPFGLQVIDSTGKSINKQYILNVIDRSSAANQIWANQSDNYYARKVVNPFRIIANPTAKTYLSVGDQFRYQFGTQNHVGSPVFAFHSLPDGIVGDVQTGTLSGVFTVPGIYTIGVESADQAGNTAEGFVTITCGNGGISSLNKVTVANKVPFVYDINAVQQQQVEADKQLFDALAAVNDAKAEVATRQGLYDGINVKLVAAEADADKAAAAAAKANTDRENAANRLTQTNKALNDAEDKLNLALLYQAGAQSNVKKAEANLQDAQDRFNAAQKLLANAEKALQAAQAVLNEKKLAETQANTNLLNAQKDYNRANEDLNQAKNALSAAQDALDRAQADLTKAKNDLSLASQAWDQATHALKEATLQLAQAEAARQAALKVLQDATAANQKATTALGAAEWNLNQAVAALNVANAAKDAADRTSALVIANGVPQSNQVDVKAVFTTCTNIDLPRYSGSVRVVKVYADRALLVTGNTILFGGCTQGKSLIVAGATISISGAINPANKCIEVYRAVTASLA